MKVQDSRGTGDSTPETDEKPTAPVTEDIRRNVNRGYRKLRVWQWAVEYYQMTYETFRSFPYESRRIASHAIGCADSIHRNIAEGYCRRSIREYIQFLYVALGSTGESVSSLHAYLRTGQLSRDEFERLDTQAYKLENGLTRLIASLQEKGWEGSWEDAFCVREDSPEYEASSSAVSEWRAV